MRRVALPTALLIGWTLATSAVAQDDWEDDEDIPIGDDKGPPPADTPPPPTPLDTKAEDSDSTLDDFADPEASDDLLGDEGGPTTADSADTPAIYRDTVQKVEDASPDDELQVWEEYLATYPGSPFTERIQKRITELEALMYSGGIEREGGPIDAMDEEVGLSQALQLENMDPRTRLQLAAEWGLPAYINLQVDYEHAIARTFSVHAGVRRRFTGYSVEPGVHWALVKSTRTDTLLTVIADFRINTIPAYPAFRPQLAFGKRAGIVDFQVQAGTDLGIRKGTVNAFQDEIQLTETVLLPAIVGGFHLTFDASETVKVFAESSVYMRFSDAGNFRYNTASFGMKFFPKKDRSGTGASDDLEVNMGASVPYTYNYWTFHYGSVMVQSNLYL